MFAIGIFLLVCIAGGVMTGSIGVVASRLIVAIDDDDLTINVTSTQGFPDYGIVVIGNEHIAYGDTTNTTFVGGGFLGLVNPLLRGTENTDAVAHAVGEIVRVKSGAMMNIGTDYFVAILADSAGVQAFLAKPAAFFQILGSFLFLPLGFVGTDLQILTYVWAIVGIGILVALFIALAGGRHV